VQVVVAVIEGEPPDPRVFLQLIEVGEPLTEQGGLAESSGADMTVSRWPASKVVPSRSATLGRATSCGRR
jgi:hypothetical protein